MMILLQVSLLLEVILLNIFFVVPVSDDLLDMEENEAGVWIYFW